MTVKDSQLAVEKEDMQYMGNWEKLRGVSDFHKKYPRPFRVFQVKEKIVLCRIQKDNKMLCVEQQHMFLNIRVSSFTVACADGVIDLFLLYG